QRAGRVAVDLERATARVARVHAVVPRYEPALGVDDPLLLGDDRAIAGVATGRRVDVALQRLAGILPLAGEIGLRDRTLRRRHDQVLVAVVGRLHDLGRLRGRRLLR